MSSFNQISKQKKRKSCSAPSYLLLKPTGLFFRIAVPSDLRDILGKKEYKLALKTCSLKEGRPKVMRLALLAQDAFNSIRELIGKNNMTKELTDDIIRKIADEHIKKSLHAHARMRITSDVTCSKDMLEKLNKAHSMVSDSFLDEARCSNFEHVEGLAKRAMKQEGIDASRYVRGNSLMIPPSEHATLQYKKLCLALSKAQAEVFSELANPDFLFNHSLLEDGEKQDPSCVVPIAAPAVVPTAPPKTSPRLEEVLEEYVSFKKRTKWSTKDGEGIIGEFKELVLYYRPFLCIHELDVEVLSKYYNYITLLPSKQKRTRAEYRGKTVDELLKMKIPESDRLNATTMENRLSGVNSFLKWLGDRQILENVRVLQDALVLSKDLKEKVGDNSLRAFSIEELKALFLSPVYKGEAKGFKVAHDFWMPLLALFTGARLNELVQLHLSDIQEVDGVHYLHITTEVENEDDGKKRVKSRAAKRKVPIHSFLIELGFLDRVAWLRKNKMPHLFHRDTLGKNTQGKIGNVITQKFLRYRRKWGVGGQKDEVTEVDFHSFRRTFITWGKLNNIDRLKVKAIVGHSKGDDVTSIYEDAYPVPMLYDEVISKLNFHEELGLEVLKSHAKKWENMW